MAQLFLNSQQYWYKSQYKDCSYSYLLTASVPRPKLINILGLLFAKLQNDSAKPHIFTCGDPGVRPDPEIRTREIFVQCT